MGQDANARVRHGGRGSSDEREAAHERLASDRDPRQVHAGRGAPAVAAGTPAPRDVSPDTGKVIYHLLFGGGANATAVSFDKNASDIKIVAGSTRLRAPAAANIAKPNIPKPKENASTRPTTQHQSFAPPRNTAIQRPASAAPIQVAPRRRASESVATIPIA